MNQHQFKAWMQAAKIIGGDYAKNYCLGLHHHYHGKFIRTAKKHGEGYREGFAGKPPKGMHGNIGNQHAAKQNKSEASINLRVPADLKAHCVAKANKQGLNLSSWIQNVLQEAVKNKKKEWKEK